MRKYLAHSLRNPRLPYYGSGRPGSASAPCCGERTGIGYARALHRPGATDGRFLTTVGIPTYGIEPLFLGPDFGHIHGLNEYVGVKSLMERRDALYRLVRIYADQK